MLPHTRRTELTTCFEFAAAGRIPYTGRLGILSAEDKQQVHNALELVGAAHLADRDFNCVSDGQRQRILLARAVCPAAGRCFCWTSPPLFWISRARSSC